MVKRAADIVVESLKEFDHDEEEKDDDMKNDSHDYYNHFINYTHLQNSYIPGYNNPTLYHN